MLFFPGCWRMISQVPEKQTLIHKLIIFRYTIRHTVSVFQIQSLVISDPLVFQMFCLKDTKAMTFSLPMFIIRTCTHMTKPYMWIQEDSLPGCYTQMQVQHLTKKRILKYSIHKMWTLNWISVWNTIPISRTGNTDFREHGEILSAFFQATKVKNIHSIWAWIQTTLK